MGLCRREASSCRLHALDSSRSVSLMLLHSRLHCCSSRECQQADWKAGHKHACKKLRKQRQAEARRAAAGDADGSSGEVAEGGDVASEAKDGGSKERPEESNSTPPLPKQASVCLLWGCHSLPAILSACCTLAGAITPCHAPTNWCCCCRPPPHRCCTHRSAMLSLRLRRRNARRRLAWRMWATRAMPTAFCRA